MLSLSDGNTIHEALLWYRCRGVRMLIFFSDLPAIFLGAFFGRGIGPRLTIDVVACAWIPAGVAVEA